MADALHSAAITSYVDQVRPDLWGPFWTRKRIEAELTDHLSEAVERLQEKGLPRSEAEQRALEAFGSPGEVAHAFARSKGVGVPTRFTRWSGLALMIGFPILLAALIYADISWSFSIGWFAEIASAAGVLVVAGLIGMYLRLRGQLGRLGRMGFRMMLFGFIVGMASGSMWFVAGAVVGLGIMLAGVATYVYGMFKTSVFPRSASGLIAAGAAAATMIGSVGFFTGLDTEYLAGPAGYLLCGAGLLRIALHMWREIPEQSHETSPPAIAV